MFTFNPTGRVPLCGVMERHSQMHRTRRGSYAALFGVSTTALLGFCAFAVDIALIRLADLEIQAIADTAAHSAVSQLRRTANESHAKEMAEMQIGRNTVAGMSPTPTSVEFGRYEGGAYATGGSRVNAVRVTVEAPVPLTFGSFFWGRESVVVEATATAATRALHTVVVMDITNSWNWKQFEDARLGAVAVFDQVTATAGPNDRLGMVVFTGQYGTEYTPLLPIADALAGPTRDEWANLRTASKGGTPSTVNGSCALHGGDDKNNFDAPPGGCYPNMPREYRDENGTDHAVGIEMATRMFNEHLDPSVYRATIILTDGEPAGTGAHQQRAADGFEEDRWRSIFVGSRRGKEEVITESVDWAEKAWDTAEIHVWTVSYKAAATWMHDVAQGDGMHIRASTSADLVPIFNDIVESLPIALVE